MQTPICEIKPAVYALILVSSSLLLLPARAVQAQVPMPSQCVVAANQQLMDYGMGFDPDGTALYFDVNGKTVIANQDKIVRRNIENGSETITYKSKQARPSSYMLGHPIEFEMVEKTIVVSRDSSGRMTDISKVYDTASQEKLMNDMAKANPALSASGRPPTIKSVTSSFTYSGDHCALDQRVGVEKQGEKEEKKVYFDKKFCDKLAPAIRSIGAQNAAQCAGVLTQAQIAFDGRNQELAKEGKAMKEYSFYGQSPATNERNYASAFNLSSAIQSCSLAEGMSAGYGMLTGVPYAYGSQTTSQATAPSAPAAAAPGVAPATDVK